MANEAKTKTGFMACRRCDDCGTRMDNITVDTGDGCVLKCKHCGKEYYFKLKVADSVCLGEHFPNFC